MSLRGLTADVPGTATPVALDRPQVYCGSSQDPSTSLLRTFPGPVHESTVDVPKTRPVPRTRPQVYCGRSHDPSTSYCTKQTYRS